MTKKDQNYVQRFNASMDKIFKGVPGAWHGNMPSLDTQGFLGICGNIALDPAKAAIGIQVIGKLFVLKPSLEIHDEPNGKHSILVCFHMTDAEQAKVNNWMIKRERTPLEKVQEIARCALVAAENLRKETGGAQEATICHQLRMIVNGELEVA